MVEAQVIHLEKLVVTILVLDENAIVVVFGLNIVEALVCLHLVNVGVAYVDFEDQHVVVTLLCNHGRISDDSAESELLGLVPRDAQLASFVQQLVDFILVGLGDHLHAFDLSQFLRRVDVDLMA